MSLYLIAATKKAMALNEGVEIIGSSISEALDRYESMGGPCVPDGDGNGAVWVKLPDGLEIEGFIECLEAARVSFADSEPEHDSATGLLIA